jgi:leader peptidase (prepilin peptidase)/N-methyltransferase
MTASAAILGALLGLSFGSFVNVIAFRVPQHLSIIRPASRCPHCEVAIGSRDLIPVLSWIVLRGRCRNCGARISVRYPIVEALTGLLFVAAALVLGAVWVLPAYWAFIVVTMALSLIDIDHKLIPNRVLFPGMAVAGALLVIGAVVDGHPDWLIRAVAGGTGYFAGLLVLALIAPRGGLGMGDVKLALLLGLFLGYQGWEQVVLGAFIAILLGGVVSVVLLATRRKGRRDTIPFGPYLVAGAYLTVAWGRQILDWYLG